MFEEEARFSSLIEDLELVRTRRNKNRHRRKSSISLKYSLQLQTHVFDLRFKGGSIHTAAAVRN